MNVVIYEEYDKYIVADEDNPSMPIDEFSSRHAAEYFCELMEYDVVNRDA